MENVFEKAKKAYDNIMKTAQAMFEIHEEAMKGNGVDFSVESAMCELDVLIQYSMLQIALNDGNLNENEVAFIKNLSSYLDFCGYLNQRGYQDVTWDVIFSTDEESLKEVLKEAKEDILALSKNFVVIFSLIDAMTPQQDYLEELKQDFVNITCAVMQSDGEIYKCEITNGCMFLEILNTIYKTKAANVENINNKKAQETPKKKTLKDYYVKKN